MMNIQICSLYCFKRLKKEDLDACALELEELAKAFEIMGLVLLSTEGINGTVSSSKNGIDKFIEVTSAKFDAEPTAFKVHSAASHPFKRFKVQLRGELVTLSEKKESAERVTPLDLTTPLPHLEAEEWNSFLHSGRPFTLIDVRNWYETKCGMFPGAVDPGTSSFSEFPEWVKKSQLNKSQPVLMYCTGGIRCEKAAMIMKQGGFEEVYQLSGGILRYFETAHSNLFNGECFVFDHRVAVDSALQPSERFRLCPHCGNPGEKKITCANCSAPAQVCDECVWPKNSSCSKNCAHHLKRNASKLQAVPQGKEGKLSPHSEGC